MTDDRRDDDVATGGRIWRDAHGTRDLDAMLGVSPAMIRLRALVQRVCNADAAVLVRGPNGSGKELVAQALHGTGRRAEQPLVAVNCAAVAPGLMESEFFGHERGSFTTAVGRRIGCLEAAGAGTLFLDEVAELSPELQAKLLRVLESRRFQRVGAGPGAEIPFRARVVAATHQDLEDHIARGRFREDLYFRLNVVQLSVPPLEQRRDDIPLLVEHFLRRHTGGKGGLRILPEAMEHLQQRPWPGHVRELRNAVERLCLLCDGEVTLAEAQRVLGPPAGRRGRLQELARQVLALCEPSENKLELMEQALVQVAMDLTANNRSEAARVLGVHRKAVERRWLRREARPPRPRPSRGDWPAKNPAAAAAVNDQVN